MATTVLGDLTDAIPMMDANGAGEYLKGRNNVRDFRTQLLLGLVAKSGSTFTARPGVIAPGAFDTTLKIYTAGRATAAGTPNQTITIEQARWIIERTGQGPYLVSQEGSVVYTLPAADASNPRIDVVYAIPYDKGVPALADAVHGPKVVCETGTPAASPTVPSIPADAHRICEVYRRTTGASPSGNAIAQTDITPKSKGTSWHGTPRPLLPGDSVSDNGGYHGEVRMLTGANVDAALIAAGTTILFEYWDAPATTWRRINGRALVAQYAPTGNFSVTSSDQICDSLSFNAIAGHTYRFAFEGSFILNTAAGKLYLSPHIAAGASVSLSDPRPGYANNNRQFDWDSDGGAPSPYSYSTTWPAPTTGQYTLGWQAVASFGATSGLMYGTNDGRGREHLITDLDY